MPHHRHIIALALAWVTLAASRPPLIAVDALPEDITQLVVSIAHDWDASHGKLQQLERTREGWRAVSDVVPVLYGKGGLAWGRGVLGTDEPGRRKVEGDGRAPAGVFAIGTLFGYDATAPAGAALPYHQVTDADAWVEDPTLPEYNRHVIIDPAHPPPWFERERMKLHDPAFLWRVEIRHNAGPIEPGAGSAIFFHIRRGPNYRTAGCTTMTEENLLGLIQWLRPEANPHYLLLPWNEYKARVDAWKLPPVAVVQALAPAGE